MIRFLNIIYILIAILSAYSCNPVIPDAEDENSMVSIYPDYTDLDIPVNIAPLNFRVLGEYNNAIVKITGENTSLVLKATPFVSISVKKWHRILTENAGKKLEITVYLEENRKWKKYTSFFWNIRNNKIDSHLMYRLIEPGYAGWNRIGIYQRNLENFNESVILDNELARNGNCMNCHTVCQQNPEFLLFHVRNEGGGTFFIRNGEIKKVNTKIDGMLSPGAYPAWHPSGRYAIFVTNNVKQSYHTRPDKRTEVYDLKSDLVLYDIDNNEIFTSSSIASNHANETFASFSPDGKKLYFCSVSDTIDLPDGYRDVKYSLVAVDFDPEKRRIGEKTDTLINGPAMGKSVSHPHVSPDGRYIMYSMADHGTFQSWNKEADLWLYNLNSGINRPLNEVNSNMPESCNSWSSCSRWIVFSSRREDGLYNRPFISYINEDGSFGKPFIVPQKDPDFYTNFFKAYNLPELMNGPVTVIPYKLAEMVNNPEYKPIQAKPIR